MTVGMYGGKFLPFHNGHAYMIDACSKQVDKLYVVVSSSEKRDRQICERDGVKYMPGDIRASWIGRWIKQYKNVEVVNVVDEWGEEDYDWEKGSELIINSINEPITHVFSSEPEYGEFFSSAYNAEHIVVDADRSIVPISATEIRRNINANLYHLPKHVASFFVKKVAIVGVESCGKSTMAMNLAKHYNTTLVPEVGRYYCEQYKNQLTVGMFDDIAMDHYRLTQTKQEDANKLLFVDSEAVITQYYLDMYHKEHSPLIDEIIKKQDFDLILYLEPDVPWVADGYRFSEASRKEDDKFLKGLFAKHGIEYIIISGSYEERFEKAAKIIDTME